VSLECYGKLISVGTYDMHPKVTLSQQWRREQEVGPRIAQLYQEVVIFPGGTRIVGR